MRIETERGTVMVRPLEPDDSVEQLTDLLHRAYAGLAAMGLRFLATHQTPDVTADRCASGETYVGVCDGQLVSTITLRHPMSDGEGYYGLPSVASFGQFGVEPHFQRSGLGRVIMEFVEDRARELGYAELACDTAQPAAHLVKWYQSMGYHIVEEADWRPTTNYLSYILAKKL